MAKPDGGLIGRLRASRDDASGPLWIPELTHHRADFERLRRELHVLEAAQEDGRRNKPGAADTDLNAAQSRIVGRIVTGLRELNHFLAEQMGDALAQAQKQAPKPLTAEQAGAEIDSHLAHVLAERRGELVSLREQELETLRDLNYFRRRHGLHRSANYRETSLLFVAILVGMFVVESFVNAFLLRRISEQGWVGGVVLAGVISLVNIGLGICGGAVGWRLIGHRFPLQKTIGWLVSIAALVLAFFWNIYAAHFREVAELAADTGAGTITSHAVDALAHIRAHGLFGLTTLFSWGLFALGMLIHLAASREAWDDMADRYWDYRRYDRAYRTARLDYEDAVADAKDEAGRQAQEVLGALEAAHAGQVQQANRLAALAELGALRLAEAKDAEGEWIRQGASLLKAYRDENVHVRTDPPPAYFERYPSPDDYRQGRIAGAPGVEAQEAEISRQAAERAQQQLKALGDSATRVHAENGAALAALRARLSETMARLQAQIDGLKQSVDKEAGDNLARRTPDLHVVSDDAAA